MSSEIFYKKHIGNEGEKLAVKYLKKLGYKILETNYKNNFGEIDIICEMKKVTVFVEVKTRSSEKYGLPREAVGYYKQQKIRTIATFYLKINDKLDKACRFDVVEILNNEIVHIENAF